MEPNERWDLYPLVVRFEEGKHGPWGYKVYLYGDEVSRDGGFKSLGLAKQWARKCLDSWVEYLRNVTINAEKAVREGCK